MSLEDIIGTDEKAEEIISTLQKIERKRRIKYIRRLTIKAINDKVDLGRTGSTEWGDPEPPKVYYSQIYAARALDLVWLVASGLSLNLAKDAILNPKIDVTTEKFLRQFIRNVETYIMNRNSILQHYRSLSFRADFDGKKPLDESSVIIEAKKKLREHIDVMTKEAKKKLRKYKESQRVLELLEVQDRTLYDSMEASFEKSPEELILKIKEIYPELEHPKRGWVKGDYRRFEESLEKILSIKAMAQRLLYDKYITDPIKVAKLYNLLIDENNDLALLAVETIPLIAILDHEQAYGLISKGIQHENPQVSEATYKSLLSITTIIAEHNPALLVKIAEDCWEPPSHYKDSLGYFRRLAPDYHLREVTIETLKALISTTVLDEHLEYLRDQEWEAIEEYLDSKYSKTETGEFKSPRSIYHEIETFTLAGFMRPQPERLKYIISQAKAKDWSEVMKCARFQTKDIFLKTLGKGANGTTYLAYSPGLEALRAIKVVDEKKFNHQEGPLQYSLKHRNIAEVHDVYRIKIGGKDEDYAIAMEYVDGKTLYEIVEEERLNKVNVDDYGKQMLEGISYLRSNNVFHRDLHLRNVMVDRDGTLKILDFGIAVNGLNKEPKDNRKYGGESDIFSWGLMMYKMATGSHLLKPKDAKRPTTYYADSIREKKGTLRKKDGALKANYRRKIEENVPQEYVRPIIWSLENLEDDSFSKIYQLLNPVDETKKREFEAATGTEISDDTYYKLMEIAKK